MCQRDCITIKPSKIPDPSKVPKPSKEPNPTKIAEPEYYTVEVTYPCDGLPQFTCCDFYNSLPSDTANFWSLCSEDSADGRAPSYDEKKGECTIFMFALAGTNGIDDADFQAAQDSVVDAACSADATACEVKAKEGQSLASIYAASSSALTVSAALLVFAVLAALL